MMAHQPRGQRKDEAGEGGKGDGDAAPGGLKCPVLLLPVLGRA